MHSEKKSRVLYENLDTTFVNLWALLRKLSQSGFIGRVHVELKDYSADIFMTGSSTPLVHEIDRAAGTDTMEETALHRLVLRVRETPGTISVFEGAGEAIAPEHRGRAKTEPAELHSIDESGAALSEISSVKAAPNATPLPEANMNSQIQPAPESDSGSPPALVEPDSGPASPPNAEPIDEIEWEATVKVSGEMVGGVERALSGAGADFETLFHRARLDLADDYTFLDPMAGTLTYANAVITLHGESPGSAYVIGLSETLRHVVDAVATGDRARRLRERVAVELLSVARKRRELMERSGFLSQLDRIAGTKVL